MCIPVKFFNASSNMAVIEDMKAALPHPDFKVTFFTIDHPENQIISSCKNHSKERSVIFLIFHDSCQRYKGTGLTATLKKRLKDYDVVGFDLKVSSIEEIKTKMISITTAKNRKNINEHSGKKQGRDTHRNHRSNRNAHGGIRRSAA